MLNGDISQSGGRLHVRPEPRSINTATHLLTGSLTSPSKPCRQVFHSLTSSVDRIRLQTLQAFSSFLRVQIQPHFVVGISFFPVHFFELLHRIFHCVGISRDIRSHFVHRRRGHNDNAQIYSSSSAQAVTRTKEEKATDARTRHNAHAPRQDTNHATRINCTTRREKSTVRW